MNAKQTAPLAITIAAAAPELLVIGAISCGIYFGLKWLLSEDKDTKPEVPPSAPAMSERPAIRPLISAGNVAEKPIIPSVSAEKPVQSPVLSATAAPISAIPVPVAQQIPIPPPSVIPAVKIQPEIPSPMRNKIISREDMAKIFIGGRGLTRKAAVSAFKALGFGKTAAYQALEINGRFSHCLEFASDGRIFWK